MTRGKKLIINPGDTFENKHWKIIKEIDKKNGARCFLCECLLCNNEYEVKLDTLTNENSSFCCASCAMSRVFEIKADELVGKKFGRLTVLSKHSAKNGKWRYNCSCSCGNEKVIAGRQLTNGDCVSCGCYQKEIASKTHSGENSYRWKGGITPQTMADRSKLGQSINPLVRERDDYTCQECSQYGGQLEVHHIFDFSNYPELRFELYNLITLCKTCHDNFHSIYPMNGTNTLNDLEDWMNKEYQYRNELLEIFNAIS